MPDGRRRSREHWTDSMEAGPPVAAAHTHRLPPVVRIAVVGLTSAVFLLLVAVGILTAYVVQQQMYIQGKGEQRDRENAEQQERQREGICDLLDTLPEGGLLDRPRAKYHCGPGIPLSQLTPEEQSQISRVPLPPSPPPAPQPTVPAPPMGTPATPNVEQPPVAPVPPRTGPGPGGPEDPTAAPQPLRPVTDLVCDVTGVC